MVVGSRTYVNDVESLVNGGLGVEGEAGIDLGGDLAGDDLEDLLAKLDEEAVESGVDLAVNVTALLLGVLDGGVDQLGVLGLLGGSEDERGVGGGILRLVLANGCVNVLVYCCLKSVAPIAFGSRGGITDWQSHQSRTRRPKRDGWLAGFEVEITGSWRWLR